MENLKDFYDQLSSRYTELISKCVPRYGEMLGNMFLYFPDDFKSMHLPPGSYDLVMSGIAIHHIEDPYKIKLGSTEENWKMWMDHQDAHDHHSPVGWHLDQLQEAGFMQE